MPPVIPELEHAQQLLEETTPSEGRYTRFIPLLALLVVAVICAVFYWQTPRTGVGSQATAVPDSATVPRLLTLPITPTHFLAVQAGLEQQDDLFLCTETFQCTNLTQSPVLTELWPVLNASANRVAYYSLGELGTEIFVLTLPTTTTLPVTVRAGTSGLHIDFEIITTHGPAFSPEGVWLAFLAQACKGEAVELFVARTDGQQVLRVTDLGYQVQDYVWLDVETLLVLALRPDGTASYWITRRNGSAFQLKALN